jgi:tetratricopeptide (TPR) repeat protein
MTPRCTKRSPGRAAFLAPERPIPYIGAMSDLADRLQTSLGDAYRIERELGGGGMSHVFLAKETALGRSVVVKVLPPEMAASVNIERFRREIQLAASLQHPHIVPVLAAGQSGDLLYYTMPLVEGESLRAKLAREGEMPVSDAVRVLRDVVDALAYAHARGVVHRDIKPDNVLITGQHAVVTDFGVAKAMSASSGSSSLTSLGVALGTPAYMAPEQAAADPNVDHRADLYAVGAMAYEMLCGRPPFSGMSPQQVLAAHVTLPPAPLSGQRTSVPPALNTLVMRCLEKKPADRIQTAAEMLTQLQAMATPSGGMAPTGATGAPGAFTSGAFTSGAEAALRRANPVRVAILFALASIAVLAVVFVLRTRLGLPDWVLPGAALLLVIGLPIMLLTGRKERERVLAAATGTYRVPDAGVAKHLTWRKAILGGGLAFGALVAIVIGYTVMRVLGIGSIGTLQAKGLLKERQPILLAEFENRSSDSTLGPTLTEALRVDLTQSQSVKLVDGQAVSDALIRMQRPGTSVLTPTLARELAQREGIPAIVTGEIAPVGKSYVISASVVSTANASVLTALRETAANEGELIPAVDRLSRALRERVGESLITIRADAPLAHVTTGSLDALRKYSQGMRLSDAGREEEAIPLMQQATAIDTSFAMAWRKLSVLIGNNGGSQSQAAAAVTHAYQHRDRLSELEKQATIAHYFNLVDHDPPKEIAAYRAMLAIDPDNDIAQNNLAIVLSMNGQYAEAESLTVACIDRGQFANCPFHAIRTQLIQRKPAAAETTLARWKRAQPRDPNLLDAAFGLATWHGDYALAAQRADTLALAQAGSKYWQAKVAQDRGSLAAAQGKIAEAERQLRSSAALHEERGALDLYLNLSIQLAQLDLRYHNRPADAIAIVTAALAKHPLQTIDSSDRPYSLLAATYAMAGQPDEAERLMSEYAREVPPGIRAGDPDRFAAAGQIAYAKGRYAEAASAFRATGQDNLCANCGLFDLAQTYIKLSQPDSARVAFERYDNLGGTFRVISDANYLAASYQRLGELYEAKGDRAKARDYYEKLIALWKDADPELQPIVRDAKERVARLSGEH